MLRTLLMIGAVVAGVLALCPKRPKRVGIFLTGPATGAVADVVELFKQEMLALKRVEGKNTVYELHAADRHLRNDGEMLAHARKLIDRERHLRPDIIWLVNTGNAVVLAAAQQDAGTRIPVVGSSVSAEVIDRGLVKHPCVLNMSHVVGPTRLEKLKEKLPHVERVGVLYTRWSEDELSAIEAAASNLGVIVVRARFDGYEDVERRFTELLEKNVQAVLSTHEQLFHNTAQRIIALATAKGVPFAGYRPSFVDLGAVLSYGTSLQEQIKLSAKAVHAILNGFRLRNLKIEPKERVFKPNPAAKSLA